MDRLVETIAADGRIDADDVLAVRRQIFPDGVVTRAEADALFEIDGAVDAQDPAWRAAFLEGVADHVLGPTETGWHITDEAVAWLEARLDRQGCRRTGIALVLNLLERAYSAPPRLAALARTLVAGLAREANRIGAPEAELVRRTLYASAGCGGVAVTRAEADWLFDLDAAVAEREQEPAFGDLFVKAILNHLCGMGPSPWLDRDDMLARQRWLEAPTPGVPGLMSGAFKGGFRAWFDHARTLIAPTPQEEIADSYAARVAQAEANAALTPEEVAWVEARILHDGHITANERALRAALGI